MLDESVAALGIAEKISEVICNVVLVLVVVKSYPTEAIYYDK